MSDKLWVALGCAALLLACSSSSSKTSAKKGAGEDAGTNDAGGSAGKGGAAGSGATGGAFGARCTKAADCMKGLSCDQEVDTSYRADNLPAGRTEVPSTAYPGGSCTPVPSATFDPNGVKSCDPTQPQASQGCGSNGACVVVSVGTDTEVACRPLCNPASSTNECGHFYTCDFELRACVEGCQSDDECRIMLIDKNGDGNPDGLRYDDASKATCDTTMFRCVVPQGAANAPTGDPCQRQDDCESEGVCLQSLQTYGGLPFPGGYCTKLGCDLKGRECKGDAAVCAPLRSWTPGAITSAACLESCKVGGEPMADQLGVKGHGMGCREGYRCHYNGSGSSASADQGVCVGGNYNAITTNNVGAECKTDTDCYSPFGLGTCLSLAVSGSQAAASVCSIMDCAVPGLPDGVCGAGAECIGLNGDLTFCAKTCKDATECATGFACADDDGVSATPKICYPICFGNDDCRVGHETCKISAGSSAASGGSGTCVPS